MFCYQNLGMHVCHIEWVVVLCVVLSELGIYVCHIEWDAAKGRPRVPIQV